MDQSLVDERVLSNVINNLEYRPRHFQKINLDVALTPGLTILSKNSATASTTKSADIENTNSNSSSSSSSSNSNSGAPSQQLVSKRYLAEDDIEAYENHNHHNQPHPNHHQSEADEVNKKRLKRYAELFKSLRYRDFMNRRDDKLSNNLLASYLNKVKSTYNSKQQGFSASQTTDYKNYSKHSNTN